MSNNEEEKLARASSGLFREMKKLRELNAEAEAAAKIWDDDPNPYKVSREFSVPPILTEQEMHEKAKDIADRKNEEQEKLDKGGLGDRTMEGHYGDDTDAHEKAMERRRQRQAAKERQLDRDHGNEMD